MKVLILGATGLLGNTLYRYLSLKKNINVYGTYRDHFKIKIFKKKVKKKNFIYLKNVNNNISKIIKQNNPDFVINCLGAIKQKKIKTSEMLSINSTLPRKLSRLAKIFNFQLLQISTDCVFSGTKGNYSENDRPNAKDIYGRSKFLGEVFGQNCFTIRTSIIGHEINTRYSLLEWFLNKRGQKVSGYKNSFFNGFTTLELSKIIYNYFIKKKFNFKKNLMNISSKRISKYALLKIINKVYDSKITVIPEVKTRVDRTLNNKRFLNKFNYKFPGWKIIIKELNKFNDKTT